MILLKVREEDFYTLDMALKLAKANDAENDKIYSAMQDKLAKARRPDPLSERLDQQYIKVRETVLAKNHDYGGAWRKHGVIGVLVRISDKVLRLSNLSDGRTALVPERQAETLLDIAGYALLGMTVEGA